MKTLERPLGTPPKIEQDLPEKEERGLSAPGGFRGGPGAGEQGGALVFDGQRDDETEKTII